MRSPLIESNKSFPQLDQISEENFIPAFERAMETTELRYQSMRDSNEFPTFKNAIVPFDTLFSEIQNLRTLLGVLTSNAQTESLVDIKSTIDKQFSLLEKSIYQDPQLAEKIKTIYEQKDKLDLDREDLWFLENVYREFKSNGAFLDETQKTRLKDIDTELITLAKAFSSNMSDAQEQLAILIDDESMLDGIPADIISGFRKNAINTGHDHGWLLMPERLLIDNLLSVAENRELRKKMHLVLEEMGTKAPFNNEPVIKQMHALRHERASIFDYSDFAEYKLSGTMAGSLERVKTVLRDTAELMLAPFERDMAFLQELALKRDGINLEPWDVAYYAALHKQDEYAFDADDLSQYLEMENVMNGWIQHVSKSMNVSFQETDAYPVWHEDVRVFEVTDLDTNTVSILCIDLYARPDLKRGGAWMGRLQAPENGTDKLNVITMNMNLVRPEEGKPTLFNKSQIETLYHEGGHSLNNIKGTETKYNSRMGTGVGKGNGSDFVEIHSTLHENWAFKEDVLSTYAFHHETGEEIPSHIVEAMGNAGNFMASTPLLRLAQNSLRDLHFHSAVPGEWSLSTDLEDESNLNDACVKGVRPYSLTRFTHLFSTADAQYAAGYYGYFWSDIAQASIFTAFEQDGLYNPALLEKMSSFFATGCGVEPNEAYKDIEGTGEMNPSALLEMYGINDNAETQQADLSPRQLKM